MLRRGLGLRNVSIYDLPHVSTVLPFLSFRWMSKEPAEIFEAVRFTPSNLFRKYDADYLLGRRRRIHHPIEAPLVCVAIWATERGPQARRLGHPHALQRHPLQPGLPPICRYNSHTMLTKFLYQVLNGKFQKEFTAIEDDLEKEGDDNPLAQLYIKSAESELGQGEKRVRARLGLS